MLPPHGWFCIIKEGSTLSFEDIFVFITEINSTEISLPSASVSHVRTRKGYKKWTLARAPSLILYLQVIQIV